MTTTFYRFLASVRSASMLKPSLFSLFCHVHIWAILLFAVVPAHAQETLYWVSGGDHNLGLTDNDLSQTGTIYCGDTTATTTFTNPNSVATSPYPDAIDQATSGQNGGVARMQMDSTATGQTLTFSITFGNVVDNLTFSIFDVDRSTNNWTDNLQIAAVNGSGGGTNVNLACNDSDGTCSYAITNNNTATATATGNANNTSHYAANGRLDVSITGPVKTVTLTYTSGPWTVSQVISIGGFTFNCTTVPVTVASFSAQPTSTGVQFDWTTATETANVGFYLYSDIDGAWRRLSPQLIRSRTIDSLAPQSYRQHISGVTATQFALAEVDIRGQERRHGPYQLGAVYGQPVTAPLLDWEAIQVEQLESAAYDRELRAASAQTVTPNRATAYEIRVNQTGLYRVTYEDLVAAGLNLQGVPINQIALTNRENPVPLRVESESTSGVFGPGGFIEFLGEALDTLYTAVNVYRLEVDATKALRVRTVDGLPPAGPAANSYPAKTLIEENREYSFAAPNGDPWFDTSLLAFTAPLSQSFSIPVDHLVGNGPATLHVNLWGVTDWQAITPDHHVVIALNGVEVAKRTFDGLVNVPLELPVPSGVVKPGANTLTITLPGDTGADFDLVHLESYGITYPRAFRASNGQLTFPGNGGKFQITSLPSSQVVVYSQNGRSLTRYAQVVTTPESDGSTTATFAGQRGSATYFVSTVAALRKPHIRPARLDTPLFVGRANYLIIAHASFLDGLAPLIAVRQQQGFAVHVVDVEDLYARYSGGVVDPLAIQRYIRAAYQRMGIEYVLLVGGDSYDYHNYLGIGSTSFIPTLYAQTAHEVRFTPADALFADVNNDQVPDLSIGRFPVRTHRELDALVAKTLAYTPGSRSAVFAADRKEGALSFANISDQWIADLPAEWAARTSTAYIDDLEVAGARSTLSAALNQGVALANYLGHSGPSAWSFENLFTDADAATLTNVVPIVALQWGCWNGYFSEPQYDTLSNRLLLHGRNGAAAAVGATTLTKVASDHAIGTRVLRNALQLGQPLGKAILLAKKELAGEFAVRKDVILGLTVLGDPALSLGPPSLPAPPKPPRRKQRSAPPAEADTPFDE
jgi:hypothetical protein